MAKYRRVPIEVEARVMSELKIGDFISHQVDSCMKLANWCGGTVHMSPVRRDSTDNAMYAGCMTIPAYEGDHLVLPGDYVIKDAQGAFYPCKPDIFKATYEPV